MEQIYYSDYCVLGGGLAGLGSAIPLAKTFKKKVIVLDRSNPKLDGMDRFRNTCSASFKNAGILQLGILPGILGFLVSETERIYKELGINIKYNGAIQPTSSYKDALILRVSFMHKCNKNRIDNLSFPSSNKGVYKFPNKNSSNAEPESVMKTLYTIARNTPNLYIFFNSEAYEIKFHENIWYIKTKTTTICSSHLIVAAGPGSAEILETLGININVKHIYGIMGETTPLNNDFYDGNIIASAAEIKWFMRDVLEYYRLAPRRSHCTAIIHESHIKHYYTHLYAATQIRNDNKRLAVGGPRIQLPKNLKIKDMDILKPSMFQREWELTIEYMKRLIEIPVEFESKLWGGVMCFPQDELGPLIGTIKGVYNNTLHINTAYESSGFRQAMGGGSILANMLIYGETCMEKLNIQQWRIILPDNRIHIKKNSIYTFLKGFFT